VFPDIAYAGGTVGAENEGKQFANEVGIGLAFFYITGTFRTSLETFRSATGTDFAPRCFLVLVATGTFPHKVLAARSTI